MGDGSWGRLEARMAFLGTIVREVEKEAARLASRENFAVKVQKQVVLAHKEYAELEKHFLRITWAADQVYRSTIKPSQSNPGSVWEELGRALQDGIEVLNDH